jgi:predicted nucleic acid-binding Zn ribbon protein
MPPRRQPPRTIQAPRSTTPRGPEAIGDIIAQLMARKGFARVQSGAACEAAWREAAGEMIAQFTRVGNIRSGKLEITVSNSVLIQELTFQKSALLKNLKALLPDAKITDLRFRLGALQ